MKNLVSLSAGVLLGTALLHVLPEAFESPGIDTHELFVTLLAGLMFFFLLEKAELYRHSHHHEGDDPHHHHHHGFDAEQAGRGGWGVLVGDSIHNFCDGVIIAAAFLTDVQLGIVTAAAVVAHEIPQEVGDYIVLVNAGLSRRRALAYNALSGMAAVAGGVIGYFVVAPWQSLFPYLLVAASSSFIYAPRPHVAESVLAGHPDRLCDAIAERLVDAAVAKDAEALVGVEVALFRDAVTITGRVAAGREQGDAHIDCERIASEAFEAAGYRDGWVISAVPEASEARPENVLRVLTDLDVGPLPDDERGIRRFSDDQNIVVGHAAGSEATGWLPPGPFVARRLREMLAGVREAHPDRLGPDGKVLVRFLEQDGAFRWDVCNLASQQVVDLGYEELHALVLPALRDAAAELDAALPGLAIRGDGLLCLARLGLAELVASNNLSRFPDGGWYTRNLGCQRTVLVARHCLRNTTSALAIRQAPFHPAATDSIRRGSNVGASLSTSLPSG